MSVYKQPKSKWYWCQVKIAGTRVRRSTGTDDREQAEEFEHALRARLWRERKLGERGAITFKEACTRWLAETRKRTKKQDRLTLDWFLSFPELAESALQDVDRDVIERLRLLLLKGGRSEATVDRYMSVLRAMLRKAEREWRYLERAPSVPMYRPAVPEARWLTPQEFDRLCKELPCHLMLAARFAVLTGLRMRSMLRLTWDRVDTKTRRAWVPATQMKAGRAFGFPLSPELIDVLKKLRALNPEGDHVFQWEGKPIDDCNTKAFQNAVARAGLTPLRWHDLRHTFASWAVQAGASLHEVMQLGDWKSYSMVLRYGHLAPDHLTGAAQKVARFGHTKKSTARAARRASR